MSTASPLGRPPRTSVGGRLRRRMRTARLARPAAALITAVGVALAGSGATAYFLAAPPGAVRSAARTDVGALPVSPDASAPAAAAATSAAPPVRLRIPVIGVDSSLADLHVQQDGHLAAPDDPDQVGWWSEGPRPGDQGATVLVGHVDSRTGPAVFSNLSALHPGDSITVERADRSRLGFTVKALRQYAKDDFPDDQVYPTTGPPQLHLITCGGDYDRTHHDYTDNLVVYATLSDKA
ncbi:class F sortase [Kitasatospora sp. NBC_01250]|uniref:class F sortase n=1 Tax=unclassified Kitasatospora TaxID=2633591 RepID=UPI002E1307F6|nr:MULTISPECIES: class F sortase [unclassified Kitasatospora]WSJ64943.1 class F sortase [Kitasatospora sp. NBC_01302]